jgi:predicted nucleic acid-binding protein
MKEKTLTVTEFKAKCLSLLDNLERDGIVLTKRGQAIAKVLPISVDTNEKFIGSMKGRIRIKGDLLQTGIHWDVESGHARPRRAPNAATSVSTNITSLQLRRLEMDFDDSSFRAFLNRITIFPITLQIARRSTELDFSSDPADEIIAATSIVERVPLLTRDRRILKSRMVPFAR